MGLPPNDAHNISSAQPGTTFKNEVKTLNSSKVQKKTILDNQNDHSEVQKKTI